MTVTSETDLINEKHNLFIKLSKKHKFYKFIVTTAVAI